MSAVIDFLFLNLDVIAYAWFGGFSLLSGVLELAGKTGASKVCGTVAAVDVGRVIRRVKERRDVRARTLASSAQVSLLVLSFAGCSGAVTTCPVDSVPVAVRLARQLRPVIESACSSFPCPSELAALSDGLSRAEATADDVCRWSSVAGAIPSDDVSAKVAALRSLLACDESSP